MSNEIRVEHEEKTYSVPEDLTLQHCAKLAVVEDKPVMFDYWADSCDKKCFIGLCSDGEQLLVKNADEYTSPIKRICQAVDSEYIIITENSIYVVNSKIDQKPVS